MKKTRLMSHIFLTLSISVLMTSCNTQPSQHESRMEKLEELEKLNSIHFYNECQIMLLENRRVLDSLRNEITKELQ